MLSLDIRIDKLIRAIILTCIVGVTSPAMAVDYFVTLTEYKVWSNTYTGTEIRVFDLDGVNNPHPCPGTPDSYLVSTSLPEAVRYRIYSTLIAAKTANAEVQVILSGCQGNAPRIVSVVLK